MTPEEVDAAEGAALSFCDGTDAGEAVVALASEVRRLRARMDAHERLLRLLEWHASGECNVCGSDGVPARTHTKTCDLAALLGAK